jgi:iron complex transport system substrate-binding protein
LYASHVVTIDVAVTRRALFSALSLAMAIAGAATPGAAAGQRVSVSDDEGRILALPRPAQRVVALAPHLTELVFAAGGGAKLVGVIRYSDHPAAARALPVVGDAFALNLERIAQLRPDLVLVWHSGLGQRQREQLRALKLPVYESEIRRVDDIAATLHRVGTLLGTAATADAAANSLMQRWIALQARYAARAPVRVFYQLWQQPLMTINGEHLIAQAITACGGVNVFASLPGLTPTVSWEAAAQSDPELIAGARVDRQTMPQGRWAELTQVEAVKHQRYALLPPELLGRMGPRFIDGAQLLCEAIDKAR